MSKKIMFLSVFDAALCQYSYLTVLMYPAQMCCQKGICKKSLDHPYGSYGFLKIYKYSQKMTIFETFLKFLPQMFFWPFLKFVRSNIMLKGIS